MAPKADITWRFLEKSEYRWGDRVIFQLNRLKMGSELELRVTISKKYRLTDSEKGSPQVTRIILKSKGIEKTGYEKFDESSKVLIGTTEMKLSDVPSISDKPHIILCCKYLKTSIDLTNPIHVPCPYAMKDEKIEITLQLYEDGAERIGLARRGIEFLSRQISLQEKFREFLEWQEKMIYGPPIYEYDSQKHAYTCKADFNKIDKMGQYYVSATGVEDPAIVCITFADLFIAYWFNYHRGLYENKISLKSGQNFKSQAAAYAAVLNKLTPVCEKHMIYWVREKPKKFGNVVTNTSAEVTVAELNDPTKGLRKSYRVSDGGDVVDDLIAPPRFRRNRVEEGDVVIRKKNQWLLIARTYEIECPKKKKGEWHWGSFYQFAKRDSRPGDIYLCGGHGHVWLVVCLGPGFTAQRKYVFGKSWERPDDDCAPGLYQIHASGPGPAEVLYDKYKMNEAKIVKVLEEYERKKNESSSAGVKYSVLLEQLNKKYIEAKSDPKVSVLFVHNATNLTIVNGEIRKPTEDEIKDWSSKGGAFYNLANAELILDRGFTFLSGDQYRFYVLEGPGTCVPFQVYKLKRILENDTGWIDERVISDPSISGPDKQEFKKRLYNDCRPVMAIR